MGPFLGPKLSCLNIFVTKSITTIFLGFFDFQPNPLLNDSLFLALNNFEVLIFTLQGVPFKKLQKQKAVAQKRCIFDPMLVKPKRV